MPILHGLADPAVGAQLAALMAQPDFGPGQLPAALALLEEAGSRRYSGAQMIRWHEAARTALREALGDSAEASALWALMESLLERES
jgi:geranylgeranyl pyrophosphate synthase